MVRREAIAGITTFFTMAYIVVVNPSILSSATGMPFSGVLTATVLLASTMTLLMGVYARLPFAVAPGMGINAFFAFSLVLGQKVPWPTALGVVFWAGVLFVVISATPLRVSLAQAIPHGLRCATAAGLGIFLTFIGLRNAGLVVADPATLVKMGRLDTKALLSLLGIAIMVTLLRRRNPFAFLVGIFVVTALAWLFGYVQTPATWVSLPDFHSVFFQLDIWGALKLSLLPAMLSFLLTDLFDSLSTFIGVSQAAGIVDKEGNVPRMQQGLMVDALATLGGGLFGTSSGTAFIESSAGIEAGGRTGLTSVFTALCFLPCFFLAPVAAAIPAFATAPVLILVGALMFRTVGSLKLDKLEDAIPSFLTVVLIPLTFSVTQGILWGFISHVGMYAAAGRRREVPPMMWGIAATSAALLVIENCF